MEINPCEIEELMQRDGYRALKSFWIESIVAVKLIISDGDDTNTATNLAAFLACYIEAIKEVFNLDDQTLSIISMMAISACFDRIGPFQIGEKAFPSTNLPKKSN